MAVATILDNAGLEDRGQHKYLLFKKKMHNDVQQIKRSLKVKLGPNTLPGRQLDLRLCSLIFLLPLVSVYKCCFTVPRSEITLIGFTVMWNKAIARKLKACWGFWAQSQLAGEYVSWTSALPIGRGRPACPSGGEVCRLSSGGGEGVVRERQQIRNSEEGIRFGLMSKL